MDKLIRFNSTLKLGKKIVNELDSGKKVDTLERWMAHYIADLIKEVESASDDTRAEKATACFEAILKLWAYRNELPDGKRPFENFESVFRTLESLDLESSDFRYFPRIQTTASEDCDSDSDSESDAPVPWLKIASSLDETAKILIHYCLISAVQNTVDKSKDWIKLAETIFEETEPDVLTIRFLTGTATDGELDESDQLDKAKIEKLTSKLEKFEVFADALRDHYNEQLSRSKH